MSRRRIHGWATAVATFSLVGGSVGVGCAAAQSPDRESAATVAPPPELAGMRDRIAALVDDGELASITVGVMRDGETMWLESFGLADREQSVPATPSTSYAIGSMSKSFTGALSLAMAAQGVIDLDLPINGYLDRPLAVQGGGEWTATLRDALHMTAGIPHGSVSTSLERGPIASGEVIRRYALPVVPAGQFFEYSNFSMGVVQAAMEEHTGRGYGELLAEYLFAPIGMTASGLRAGVVEPGTAVRYSRSMQPVGGRFQPEAAAGLYASASDLLKMAAMHLGGGGEAIPSPWMQQAYEGSEHAPYGLGIGVMAYAPPRTALITNGNITGANSNLMMVPAENLAVVVLTNTSSNLADPLGVEIIDVLVPGFGPAFSEAARRVTSRQPMAEVEHTLAGEWTGEIRGEGWAEPISIEVGADEVAALTIGEGQQVEVQRASFGPGGELRISPSGAAALPQLEGSPEAVSPTSLVLFPVDGGLAGYLTVQYANETAGFARPLYVELGRGSGVEG